MAYSRIRFEIQNSTTMTLVHKPLRSLEDWFTVKKTLEFGSCKLYTGIVRLNLDEKLLEASRVEFACEQATAFVVAPNHLADLTRLADEDHEVTALGN